MLARLLVLVVLGLVVVACGGSGSYCQSGSAGTQCYQNGAQQNYRPTNQEPPSSVGNPMPAR